MHDLNTVFELRKSFFSVYKVTTRHIKSRNETRFQSLRGLSQYHYHWNYSPLNWQIMTPFDKINATDLRAAPVSRARTSPTTIPPALTQNRTHFYYFMQHHEDLNIASVTIIAKPENLHNSNMIHEQTKIYKLQCNIKARQRNLYTTLQRSLQQLVYLKHKCRSIIHHHPNKGKNYIITSKLHCIGKLVINMGIGVLPGQPVEPTPLLDQENTNTVDMVMISLQITLLTTIIK